MTINIEEWYRNNVGLYGRYTNEIKDLIEGLLLSSGIQVHSVTSRLKTLRSCIEKYDRKEYKNVTSDLTDLVGIRIIVYTLGDVVKAAELIQTEFEVDHTNSIDKSKIIESDRVGYLSVHYIAQLDRNRAILTEYKSYQDLKCEIQIRTMLQHAWAEIEHDRNYKFHGVLPDPIKRRFYLLAGALEIVDREFQNLSYEIDKHKEQVIQETQKGNFAFSIDTTSLVQFIAKKFVQLNISQSLNGNDESIINELEQEGIVTLKDLDNVLTDDIIQRVRNIHCTIEHRSNYELLLKDIIKFIRENKFKFGKKP